MLIDINKIVIKDRIRKDYGDIESLAKDIERNGLINLPVITMGNVLVSGERRLIAARRLGWKDIEVRMMAVESAEQMLLMEIAENELRKDFTKEERIEYARQLERIEAAKAEERLHLSQGRGVKGVENFPQVYEGKTRDIVAKSVGIGSGKQYEKEKFISDNREVLSDEEYEGWNHGAASTHKTYQMVKERMEPERVEDDVPFDGIPEPVIEEEPVRDSPPQSEQSEESEESEAHKEYEEPERPPTLKQQIRQLEDSTSDRRREIESSDVVSFTDAAKLNEDEARLASLKGKDIWETFQRLNRELEYLSRNGFERLAAAFQKEPLTVKVSGESVMSPAGTLKRHLRIFTDSSNKIKSAMMEAICNEETTGKE